jgi:ABC-2 type transport system permease protein
VGAKYATGVALGLVVAAILAALGFAFGWLRPPIDPLGAVLLITAFSLAGCGLMGLVFALVRTERQAGVLSWLVIMGNSALGGSMVPVENMPAPMQALTPYTLNYWAIDGFKELVFDAASTAGIARHLLVLGLAGVALAAAGWAVMVRRSREMSV